MKILLLMSALFFASSVTLAQKKAKPTPLSGEIVISNFIFKWLPSDQEGFASVRLTCPNKKDSKALNLELNKPATFVIKCSDGSFSQGNLTLADKLATGTLYGIILDSYFGDGLGTEFDMHFEGIIAAWRYDSEPSPQPTPPPTKNNTWGVKFDQKRTEDFRKEFN